MRCFGIVNSTQSPIATGGTRTVNLNLWIARGLTLGPVALAFPIATWAVFGLETDRKETADVLAQVYSFGLFLGFTTSLWPLPVPQLSCPLSG
ncbi:MAG: hypothetical protein ACI9NT_000125 [Bacteroidia bacterium]|jgi:hypothetical protein